MFDDKQRIIFLISTIKENLDFIEEEKIIDVEQLKKSKKDYLSISMALFTIQNKLIELGEELIDNLNKNIYPKTYGEVVDSLFEEKIINKEQYKLFRDFISYRNEIAHEYEGITQNEIFWCIKHLDFVKDFLKIVKNKL